MTWIYTLLFFGLIDIESDRPVRLIVVPQQTTITADAPIKFDLFLVNLSQAAQKVRSLESYSAVYTIHRPNSEQAELASYSRIFSHPLPDHLLKAGEVDHRVIEVTFKVEKGDQIELSLELGEDGKFKSNPLLLACPK